MTAVNTAWTAATPDDVATPEAPVTPETHGIGGTTTPTGNAPARRLVVPAGAFTAEPSDRRVRATIGAVTIVDSAAPLLVWEPDRPVPGHAFPRADVRLDLLTETTAPDHDRHLHVRTWYDLTLDGTTYPALVFEYDDTAGLDGYLAVDWFRRDLPGVEHWYEEAEEIFRHPRDPYKRVDAIASTRHVQVSIGGVRVADSRRPVLVFETGLPVRYYLPADDVDFTPLRKTDRSTTCPYKGDADYWTFDDRRTVVEDVAWRYRRPIAPVASIEGLIAFYDEIVDTVVDGVVQQRPASHLMAPVPRRITT